VNGVRAAQDAGIRERDDTLVHSNADTECHDDRPFTVRRLPYRVPVESSLSRADVALMD